MTADDVFSMPRDLLVALVVELSRQVEELSGKVAATTDDPPPAASLTPKALQTRLTRDWVPERDEPKDPFAKD